MKSVTIDVLGYKTRVLGAGSGPPVLLLHGGDPGSAAGADGWSENIDVIAGAGYSVFAPDRLGIALTDPPASPELHDVDHFVDHLEALVEAQIGRPLHALVGSSRGAYLGALMLKRNPLLADRFVIVNSNTLSPAYGSSIGAEPRRNVKGLPSTFEDDWKWLTVQHSHMTPEWMKHVVEISFHPAGIRSKAVQDSVREAYLEKLALRKVELLKWISDGHLTLPILLLWGVGDSMTTFQDALDLFDMFADHAERLELHAFARCGHMPFREYPERFNEQLLAFIDH